MLVSIRPDFPRGRVPISLIVDDPCPCINPLYYFRHQVDRIAQPPHERTIPAAFFRDWARWAHDAGIRGDFSILPYPAGLGRIDRGLDGFSTDELHEWLDVAREWIMPGFDIHPEILTHTLALDLDSLTLREISEHEWMDRQDESTLTRYFTEAMAILKSADVPNHGLTQPCTFTGDEAMYARALLTAEKTVNGRSLTHNFLHVDTAGSQVWPRLTLWRPEAGEAVVSVWSMTDDVFWITQDRDDVPESRIDALLSPDGRHGRLADLLDAGGPIVFHTHWQSQYSNGRRTGLDWMKTLARRIEERILAGSERDPERPARRPVQWRKLSELAAFCAARAGFRSTATETPNRIDASLESPFPCAEFTVRVSLPWPYARSEDLAVELDGRTLPYDSELSEGSWSTDGAEVSVCFDLKARHALAIGRR